MWAAPSAVRTVWERPGAPAIQQISLDTPCPGVDTPSLGRDLLIAYLPDPDLLNCVPARPRWAKDHGEGPDHGGAGPRRGRAENPESTHREGFGGLVERIEPACALPFRRIEPELRPRE
jgi:hypothetical protein